MRNGFEGGKIVYSPQIELLPCFKTKMAPKVKSKMAAKMLILSQKWVKMTLKQYLKQLIFKIIRVRWL